jgi:hypothetical protein
VKRRACWLEAGRCRSGADRQSDRARLRRDIGPHDWRHFRRGVEPAACAARRGRCRVRAARSVGVRGVGLLELVQCGAVVLRRCFGREHHGKNRRRRGEAEMLARHCRPPSPGSYSRHPSMTSRQKPQHGGSRPCPQCRRCAEGAPAGQRCEPPRADGDVRGSRLRDEALRLRAGAGLRDALTSRRRRRPRRPAGPAGICRETAGSAGLASAPHRRPSRIGRRCIACRPPRTRPARR